MRVDFYLLDQSAPQLIDNFVCRFLNKAYEADKRVFVLAESAQQATRLDALLWAFSGSRFIPHAIFQPEQTPHALNKVSIGTALPGAQAAPPQFDLLLNLQNKPQIVGEQFNRVAELVSSDEAHKAAARTRYSAWRDKQAELKMHPISIH